MKIAAGVRTPSKVLSEDEARTKAWYEEKKVLKPNRCVVCDVGFATFAHLKKHKKSNRHMKKLNQKLEA